MELYVKDYNGSEAIFDELYFNEWDELSSSLAAMPLHLKASDQRGKQGQAIFDPVGTNCCIKDNLSRLNWIPNQAIPNDYKFLGTDIDFVKSGIIVEVQFSNYPFLLNNLLRSELFYQSKTSFDNSNVKVLVVVTKLHMLPASNSTLYYEQACNQLDALASNNVFDVPVRLVGLGSPISNNVPCVWTTYDDPRYSRTVEQQENICVEISRGRLSNSRSVITR